MNKKEELYDIKTFKKATELIKFPDTWVKTWALKNTMNVNVPEDAEQKTKNKIYLYINISTNEIKFHHEDEYIDCSNSNCHYLTFEYATYIKEYDCIGMIKSYLKFRDKLDRIKKVRNIKKDETRFYLPTEKKDIRNYMFIFRDKKVIYVDNYWDGWTMKYTKPKEHSYTFFQRYEHPINVSKTFADFFKVGFVSGNNYTNFSNLEKINIFLGNGFLIKPNTPEQKIIDELTSIPLEPVEYKFDSNKDKMICIGDRVNNDYAVLRYFIPDYYGNTCEISRLYVSKKEHLFCRINDEGEYIYLKNKLKRSNFDTKETILKNNNVFDGTRLEYFKDIYKTLNPELKGAALYSLLMYPEMEKLYKIGLNKICNKYFTIDCSWPAFFKEFFGETDKSQRNIYKMIGFNKHQLELIGSHYISSLGADIKFVFDTNSCNDIDDKTFDAVYDYLVKTNCRYCNMMTAKLLMKVYSTKVFINLIPNLLSIYKIEIPEREKRCFDCDNDVIEMYNDYIEIVDDMGCSSEMRPNFTTITDIRRMHDDATVIYNMRKDRYEEEKFVKRSSFWKKWEYNENEKYVVIAPQKPIDLAAEGITLHHCVKSYIEDVTKGVTNIVFIREKDRLKEPFFTVEVSNKGNIEQVHGFANRNVSTEPGLIDFVEEWAKKKKLKLNSINKVR